MAKSEALNLPQQIKGASVGFNYSDDLSVWAVAPTSPGTNLTAGTRTLTAAGGTLISGGSGATTWTVTAKSDGSNVFASGIPSITQIGQYKYGAGPTAAANAATVDSGSSNATWALSVGIVKELYTASADGEIVTELTVTTSDTTARVVTLLRKLSGSSQYDVLGSMSVAASAGTLGTTAAATGDMLADGTMPGLPRDAMNKHIIKLPAGAKLYVTVPTIAAGYWMRVNLVAEDMAAAA